jgi:gamma-glutamyltranspeptidase / glutathione hydrolase
MRDYQAPGRSAAFARHGMVATSHPDAARVGLEVLREGGSAADAAIAASAVLAVAEPQNAGLGGDTFYIHAEADGRVSAYNGSGRTPWALDAAAVGTVGLDSVHSVTIPGAVDALLHLHDSHGRLPLDRLLAPAIALAAEGWTVQPRVAWDWRFSHARLSASPSARAFWGRKVTAGDRIVQPALARTLRDIVANGREGFYHGETAQGLASLLSGMGGYHSVEDFAAHRGAAVTPIETRYRGLRVLECPPNGQGMTVLLLLNILSGLDMATLWRDESAFAHIFAQACQLSYAERDRWIADPDFAQMPLATLIGKTHAARLRARLNPQGAIITPPIDEPPHRDTVYLACVDSEGNAISFINSIFTDFGSAIYDEASGLLLHNRGASFAPFGDHPNALAPGKRPMHTIIPGMVMEGAMQGGRPVMPFGVMGGHYQAAGQAFILSAMLDAGMDPQAALDLPRHFAFGGGGEVELETGVAQSVSDRLMALGHSVKRASRPIGGGQAIWIDHARGVLIGGSDPRKDGYALGY